MQSVTDAFSVEEVDSVRKIAQSFQVAWKKNYLSTIRIFTIGVSTIGGLDAINAENGRTQTGIATAMMMSQPM
jgi:hypothetical protein